jgi:hypothetical protein
MVDAKRRIREARIASFRATPESGEETRRGHSRRWQLDRVSASIEKPTESVLEAQTRAAEQIVEAMAQAFRELAERGVELTALGKPAEVVAGVIERLPLAKSRLAEAAGPCYTSGGLQTVLGMSRAALSKAVIQRRALRLETADGTTVYPAFQVHNGALVPDLRKVLTALGGAIDDPWTWAVWLNAPTGDDRAPRRRIDQLASGDVDGVVRAAMQTAAAWAA